MSSAKAQLESDTRVLAWEAGREYGIRVNTISAGPLKSRAASAIGDKGKKTFIEYAIDYSKANSPLAQVMPAVFRSVFFFFWFKMMLGTFLEEEWFARWAVLFEWKSVSRS